MLSNQKKGDIEIYRLFFVQVLVILKTILTFEYYL